MTHELSANFEITLKWDNSSANSDGRADFAILRFDPCSISEFAVYGEIQLAGQLNYQGTLQLRFETCIYAFEIAGFARRLRLLAAGEVQEHMFCGAQDFRILAARNEKVPFPMAELHYDHFRVGPMHTFSTFVIQLGPFSDPLGTADAIDRVIATLEMDCDTSPEHGPLPPRKPRKGNQPCANEHMP